MEWNNTSWEWEIVTLFSLDNLVEVAQIAAELGFEPLYLDEHEEEEGEKLKIVVMLW